MLTRTRTDTAARIPGPPELLPGCPDAVIDLQTEAGRRARRRSLALRGRARRGDRVRRGRSPRRSTRPGAGPEPNLRRRPARRGRGLRRLRLADARASRDAASPQPGTGVLQLVSHRGHHPRASRRLRPHRRQRRVRGGDRRLRGGVGRTASSPTRSATRRAGRRRVQRPQPRAADRRRAAGAAVSDRGVRDQWPDLGLAAQLHLDAHGDPRLLRPRARPARDGRRARDRPRRPGARRDRRAGRHARARRLGLRVHRGSRVEPGRCAAVQLAQHERDLPLASLRDA